ncbi:MAG: methylenetetrahydrofolate reductase [Candidatus Woesearchaeota archaeon]|nr:methylenetetrahydrofolate reductase [Candidatus Woesearchaeota archaeon]
MKLTEVLQEKGFARIVEFSPPRGTELENLISEVEKVKSLVDFVAITHNPGGKPRMDSHYAAGILKERGNAEPICHFRIRDGNRIDLYGKLMAAKYLGIENILVIKGDSPKKEVFPEFYEVSDYKNSYEFIADIKKLNCALPTSYMEKLFTEKEIEKHRNDYKTDFCIGAAGHPLIPIDLKNPSENAGQELEGIRKKVEAGAEFILTQIVYDCEMYCRYRDSVYEALGREIPIIPGVLPILSASAISFLEREIVEVRIPEKIRKAICESDKPKEEGIRIARELMQNLKENGAPGINLFARTDAETAYRILL